MNADISLSSPNTMVCNFFWALRRAVDRANEESEDDNGKKQEVAVCIFLSVTAVETFLNVYFRVLVEEEPYARHKTLLLADLDKGMPLASKLRKWPREILGKPISEDRGPGKAFADLRQLRNKLMHFTSSHQTLKVPGMVIHGLADTSAYDGLSDADAKHALRAAEDLLSEIFRLRGIPEDRIPHSLHAWTGKPPGWREPFESDAR